MRPVIPGNHKYKVLYYVTRSPYNVMKNFMATAHFFLALSC